MNTNTRVREAKDAYFRYLDEISNYPLMTRAQEKIALREVKRGNRAAMDMLVKANLRFVVNIANFYKGQGVDVLELINEGNMGLIEAARRFDISTNLKFISYAVWWIRQNITRYIAEHGRIVRISAEKELVIRKFMKNGGAIHQTIGGNYSIDPKSLEGLTKYKSKDIEKILMMGSRSSSLDAPLGSEKDITLGDTISDSENRVDEYAEKHDEKLIVEELLNDTLSEKERNIVKLHFGIGTDAEVNLKDIAPMMGMSKERVRLIKEAALAKLREDRLARELHEAS